MANFRQIWGKCFAPCVAACLLPNLRSLKSRLNERHSFRGQLTNVKLPAHMKGAQEDPRRLPLSSLDADLSEPAMTPLPSDRFGMLAMHPAIGSNDQRLEEVAEGGGVKCYRNPVPVEEDAGVHRQGDLIQQQAPVVTRRSNTCLLTTVVTLTMHWHKRLDMGSLWFNLSNWGVAMTAWQSLPIHTMSKKFE